MLLGIHVKNLALIDEVEVDFGEHLNILTGETGAGKSILIGSVNLALGGKASKDMIRKGAEAALVELFFRTEDKNLIKKLAAMDIPCEDGDIVITRKILPSRSVCRINGEVVSAKALADISGDLIDIHGQHDHQSLLYKHKHLAILDDFSKEKLGDLKQEMAGAYKSYMALSKELETAAVNEEERRREQSFIEYEIQEIETARLIAGEDQDLEAQYKKMVNARRIHEGVSGAYQFTENEAAEAVSRALRKLMPAAEYDDEIEGFVSQLTDIENLLNDFNREVSGYMDELVFDQESFDAVESRLDLINNLKAKYGQTIELIESYRQEKEERLNKLNHYEEYLDQLKKDVESAKENYVNCASEVSAVRKTQSKILAEEIKKALDELNFLDVRFDMAVNDAPHWSANGMDEAEFLISTNPGEDLKSLGSVASGGELSRIMLAIKSVLADADAIETLIFDEIDTGISGRTAQKVSERLAVIAEKHQVLCISHLPQIASMADHHYLIEKSVTDARTTTEITMLDENAAAEEIARLLGGVEITETVMDNAREMKSLAAKTKKYKL